MMMMSTLLLLTLLVGVSLGGDQGQFQYLPNSDCPKNDIKSQPDSNPDKCTQECLKLKECVAVVLNKKNGVCWLKRQCKTIVSSTQGDIYLVPEGIDRPRAVSGSFGQFQSLPNSDCLLNDIKSQPDSNPGKCKYECLKTKECVAVVLNKNNGVCWLKRKCTDIMHSTMGDLYLLPECIDRIQAVSGQFEHLPNSDCVFSDIKFQPDSNPDKCKQECLRVQQCVAFVLNRKNRVCWLKRQCSYVIQSTFGDLYRLPECIDRTQAVTETCPKNGNVCKPRKKCKKQCEGTCDGGRVCCCKQGKPGKTCASRGNICKNPSECQKKCKGSCPFGAVCCCRN